MSDTPSNEGGRIMRPGTYRDKHGDLATVRRTATGLVVSYADGRTIAVGAKA